MIWDKNGTNMPAGHTGRILRLVTLSRRHWPTNFISVTV